MKRSNRLVLLVGVFLAIVAFVGILLLVRTPATQAPTVATDGPVVVATTDIALSSRIREDQVTTKKVPLTAILPGAFTDPSQVIGQIARQPVGTGGQVTASTLNGGTARRDRQHRLPADDALHGGPGGPGQRRRDGHQDG